MSARSVKPGSLAGTRGRIIDLIRRSRPTATEIAEQLELTYNAVRVHLTALERDGLIRKAGVRRGETRPSTTYELAPESTTPYHAPTCRSLRTSCARWVTASRTRT